MLFGNGNVKRPRNSKICKILIELRVPELKAIGKSNLSNRVEANLSIVRW